MVFTAFRRGHHRRTTDNGRRWNPFRNNTPTDESSRFLICHLRDTACGSCNHGNCNRSQRTICPITETTSDDDNNNTIGLADVQMRSLITCDSTSSSVVAPPLGGDDDDVKLFSKYRSVGVGQRNRTEVVAAGRPAGRRGRLFVGQISALADQLNSGRNKAIRRVIAAETEKTGAARSYSLGREMNGILFIAEIKVRDGRPCGRPCLWERLLCIANNSRAKWY